MSHKVNLVRVFTAATGTSTPITLGSAYSQLFMTPAEAGAMDGRVYTYLIVDGNDWEMGRGAYTASGTSLARTTIIASRIAGTLGTSRITLSGTAQVRFIEAAEDMDGVRGTRVVTGTSDVLANSDQGYVVTYSNASAIGVSLAQAGSSNLFLAGWATIVQNTGGGTVTITPATSTINGAATLTLATGMGALIWSDGTNYRAYFIPGTKPLLTSEKQASNVDTTANRVLITGAFGIGQVIPLVNDNCLAVRPSGWYYFSGTTSNLPPGATEGFLSVTYFDANNIIYKFQQYNAANEWLCVRSAGSYGAWINIGSQMAADRAFRRGNVLGTVSQSSGVPTGALIEYGLNGNGSYACFADGTQWCWNDITVTDQAISSANGTSGYYGDRTMTFPKSFIAAPNVTAGRFSVDANRTWGGVTGAPTTTAVILSGYSPISISAGGNVRISYMAVGRWF